MFEKIQLGDEVVLYAGREAVADTWDPEYTAKHYPNQITVKVFGKAPNRDRGGKNMILVSLPREWSCFRKNWRESYAKSYKTGQYLSGVEDIHCYEIYDEQCVIRHIPKASVGGMICSDCGDGYHMAVPNCGALLICWSCRDSNPRKYSMVNGQVIIRK